MEVYSECQQNDPCKTEDDAPQRRQRKPFFQSDGCIDQKSGNGGSQRNGISDGSRAAGGKGVKTLNITEKTGSLVAIKNVTDENDLMIINRSGLTIRMAVSGIKVAGRATQGVRLINIKDGDAIAAVSAVNKSEEENDTAQMPENQEQTNE